MFVMVSSCPDQVDPRAGRSLGGQFACAPMYYGVFSTIVDDVTNGSLGRNIGGKKGFYVGINFRIS